MKYTFSELVDLEKVQSLMDSYCQAIGIASALIDLDGQVLVSSNWQRLCTDFHRVNEQTCKMCLESDTVLANRLGEGERYPQD
jgi:ligand-binding sensor protein